jgi:hypothetical protein
MSVTTFWDFVNMYVFTNNYMDIHEIKVCLYSFCDSRVRWYHIKLLYINYWVFIYTATKCRDVVLLVYI